MSSMNTRVKFHYCFSLLLINCSLALSSPKESSNDCGISVGVTSLQKHISYRIVVGPFILKIVESPHKGNFQVPDPLRRGWNQSWFIWRLNFVGKPLLNLGRFDLSLGHIKCILCRITVYKQTNCIAIEVRGFNCNIVGVSHHSLKFNCYKQVILWEFMGPHCKRSQSHETTIALWIVSIENTILERISRVNIWGVFW
jgi:hypothetical protein